MPTYVYGCDACGHRFEKFQKFADEPVRVCPECQSSVRRIFQPAGIVFKGSGWHVTDYKRNGSGSSSETTSDGEAKAASDGAAKQEKPSADPPASSDTPAASGDGAKSTSSSATPAKAAS